VKRRVMLAVFLVVTLGAIAALLLAASPSPPSSISSPTRRELSQKEKDRLTAYFGPEQAASWAASRAFGISKKLTEEQLDYFRARGVNEAFLLNWVAEYGITPQENEALRKVGVDMVIAHVPQATAYHWAALADVVALGTVTTVVGNPAGPYHSQYQIKVDEYLKDCSKLNLPVIEGKLLQTGPYYHEGRTEQRELLSEPNIAQGERVILFLSKVPLNLIALLQTAGDQPTRTGLEREFGEIGKLTALAESPVGFEVVEAYKVVGSKAVQKIRTLHTPGQTEVVDLDRFKETIRAIGAVQEPYCGNRAL
jgi:hypothetical protein